LIKRGVPFAEPIERAKEEKADIVVMGTKWRVKIANILFGTQTDKDVSPLSCSLLSIRENE